MTPGLTSYRRRRTIRMSGGTCLRERIRCRKRSRKPSMPLPLRTARETSPSTREPEPRHLMPGVFPRKKEKKTERRRRPQSAERMRGETNKQRRLSLVSKETREHLILTGNRIDSRKKATHRLLKACRQVSHHSLAPLSPLPVSLCLLLLRLTTRFHDANPLSYSRQQIRCSR